MAGSIQGDINQALGTLGVLAQFSPQLKEHAANMAESRKLDKREEILAKQANITGQDLDEKRKAIEEGRVESTEQAKKELNQAGKELLRHTQEHEDISRSRYDLKPTSEGYKEWQKYAALNEKVKEQVADMDSSLNHKKKLDSIPSDARRAAEYDYAYQQAYNKELANLDKQQQAMARQDRQKEAKKSQRRIFMNYLKKQPVFGETVGSIDERSPGFAKQLASQYNKSQRKAMMDRMDKEAKNGKQ